MVCFFYMKEVRLFESFNLFKEQFCLKKNKPVEIEPFLYCILIFSAFLIINFIKWVVPSSMEKNKSENL